MKTSISRKLTLLLGTILLGVGAFSALPVTAANIAQSPLFVTVTVAPNIILTLDDSGSMAWGYVPDALGGNGSGTVECMVNCPSYTATQSQNCVSGHWEYQQVKKNKYQWVYVCDQYETVTNYSYGSPYVSGPAWFPTNSVYIPDTFHFKSSAFNPLYYDPTVTYKTPYTDTATKDAVSKGTATRLTTSFTQAWVNGYNQSDGYVNLSTSFSATTTYDPSGSSQSTDSCNYFDISVNSNGSLRSISCNSRYNPGPAFYYTYDNRNSSGKCADGNAPDLTDDSCYTKHTVSATSGPGSTDERQNFANWYSFYRTRNLTTVTGANLAFSGVDEIDRVAWQNLHTCTAFASTGCSGWDSTSYDNRISALGTFDSNGSLTSHQHKKDLLDWLAHFPASGGTPLRAALVRAGQYYQLDGQNSPYAQTPYVDKGTEYECRPDYTILMTDGLWNGSDPSGFGDEDDTAITLPDKTQYNPITPYLGVNASGGWSGPAPTLADIAFYYWAHDLNTNLAQTDSLKYTPYNQNVTVYDSNGNPGNLTPYWNPENDPANWQHMVTFTVGLGLSGTLTTPPVWGGSTFAGTGFGDLVTGTSWPTPSSNSNNNVWDLWHAAINSRGEFFAADSPQKIAAAFNDIVNRVQSRTGSSSAIAVNSTRLDSNTLIYQAQFTSGDWTGDVLAYPIGSQGQVQAYSWKASQQLPALANRKIFTWNSTTAAGVNFYVNGTNNFSNLSSGEKSALNTDATGATDTEGSDRVAYLAGDQSKELSQTGGIFRTRSSLLGDIVNSNPDYVGKEDFGFTNLTPEGSSYPAFVATKSSRTPALYVGANDGMLHAFNASTGTELFAYVPRGVYSKLSKLTADGYVHNYYVDGSPQSVDAYIPIGGVSAWHTLLAGSTGAGGRDVFLLDVTNPDSFAASNVLWDYDGATAGDNDMGYTVGQPTIARFKDGDWYMIFGNGYNSPNGHAVLYMYNLDTKTLLKFDTGKGSVASPDGMSTPVPVDYNNDRVTDAIYVGDVQGNLWKIDTSSATPGTGTGADLIASSSNWGFSLQSAGSPVALFTAHDDNGNVQPITSRPQVGRDDLGRIMVYFGTGTYFLEGDNIVPSNPPIQSFYGIVDDQNNSGTTVVRSTNSSTNQLVKQTILDEGVVTSSGVPYRITSDNPIPTSSTPPNRGWYLDLYYKDATNTVTDAGERVVSDAILHGGRIIFTTLIPTGSGCDYGGNSWLMELDASTGSRLTSSPFDLTGDNKVDTGDLVTLTNPDGTTVTVAASGKKSDVGIIKTPGIITAGELEYKYYSGSTGKIGETVESAPSNTSGRLSWKQLLPQP
jgi:type IV pilus assembly protein PilY1